MERAAPVGVVLTLAASGSESNPAGAVYNEETREKGGAMADALFPVFALINPETNYTLSPFQTACGCCDIFSHLMERYFTNTPDVSLTDELLEGVMRNVLANSILAMEKPDDYSARAELNYAGTLAPNPFISSGREACFGMHRIERALGALYDSVPHGAGIALIAPAWLEFVKLHDVSRLTRFSRQVMGVETTDGDIAGEGIHRFRNWLAALGLPKHLPQVGVSRENLRAIAEKTVEGMGYAGYYVKLDADAVERILTRAW